MTFYEANKLIKKGDIIRLRQELQAGLSPNLANQQSWTLLMIDAFEGNTSIGSLLIESGVELHRRTKGNRAGSRRVVTIAIATHGDILGDKVDTYEVCMLLKWASAISVLLAAILLYSGCGSSSPNCDHLIALEVSPPSATADHATAAPGDQLQFYAGAEAPTGCFVGGCVNCSGQTWTVSDTINVSISNDESDNGLATCKGATNGPVSITATAPAKHRSIKTVSGSASSCLKFGVRWCGCRSRVIAVRA